MNTKIITVISIFAFAVAGGLLLRQNREVKHNPETQNVIVDISQTPVAVSQTLKIPLPTEEDIIRAFFALINEKRIPEAIGMMDEVFVGDESSKQAFGVQYDSLSNIDIKSIEPSMQEEWTANEKIFKVVVNLEVSEESANAPIPYYGWVNGDNVRFITVRKASDNTFIIAAIGTGP